ncbi:hypothetical protein FACS1894111_11770 [Clostridia bacterium]|nr:hypothetical protein FACS1894111_11770 [Clostridia bacterium]
MDVSLKYNLSMPAGGLDVTLHIPGIRAGQRIILLHYISAEQRWEIILPLFVSDGVVRAHFNSFSPVVVVELGTNTPYPIPTINNTPGTDTSVNAVPGTGTPVNNAANTGKTIKTSPKTGEKNQAAVIGVVVFLSVTAVGIFARRVRKA